MLASLTFPETACGPFFRFSDAKRDLRRKKAAKSLKSGEFAASTHSGDAAIMRRLFFRNVFGTLLVTGM
ncbi:hypothetical protein F3I15_09480 [Pantoea sp. M_9]|nr:hypothetical protein F3I15_09480 [Pantoea sp. M_9]